VSIRRPAPRSGPPSAGRQEAYQEGARAHTARIADSWPRLHRTEHILLGLVRENEGVAAHILLDFDADSEKIRNEVIRLVPPATRPEEAEPRPAPDDKWDHLLVLLERANDTLDRIYEVLRKPPPGGG
jgi:ATP-dependent Clp protease ATP-binding subunit ClpA